MISDRFEKLERIGKGAYAKVYKCKDTKNNEIVALKKYSESEFEGVSISRIRELACLKACDHPNIIPMLWYDNDFKYIVIPHYQQDLREFRVAHANDLNEILIANISKQILEGVYYLHSKGIMHRDIKSQNILITGNEGNYKISIIDMGLCRDVSIVDKNYQKSPVVCTLHYRPPEILLGQKCYGYEVDMWSVGCVIMELMTKCILFPMGYGDPETDILYGIFQLLGSPSTDYTKNNYWPGVSKLPKYRKDWPTWSGNFDTKIGKEWDPNLIKLVKGLLKLDPSKRLLSHEALNNSFISGGGPPPEENINNKQPIIDFRVKYMENMTTSSHLDLSKCLDNQENINVKMRIIMLDWLAEVCIVHHLQPVTYLRAQNIIDRYLMNNNAKRSNLQLIGITALAIASKMEEVKVIDFYELRDICDTFDATDHTYSIKQIEEMELSILRSLKLELYVPITPNYLHDYSDKMKLTNSQKLDAILFLCLATLNIKLMKYHPAILTLCSCICATNQTISYEEDDMNECLNIMTEWSKNWYIENPYLNKKGILNLVTRGK